MNVFVSVVTWTVCSLESVTLQQDNGTEQSIKFSAGGCSHMISKDVTARALLTVALLHM